MRAGRCASDRRRAARLDVVLGDTNSTLAARAGRSRRRQPARARRGGAAKRRPRRCPRSGTRIEVDRLADAAPLPRRALARDARGRGRPRRDRGRRRRDGRREHPLRADRARAPDPRARSPGRYVVATIHREANVAAAAARADRRRAQPARRAGRLPGAPAHARGNRARTRSRSRRTSTLVEPLGYLDFAALASQARVIVTDSGGLQKEAYWYGVPCVTAAAEHRVGRHGRARREHRSSTTIRTALAAAVAAARPLAADRPALYGDGPCLGADRGSARR